jgi:hypothetical protein
VPRVALDRDQKEVCDLEWTRITADQWILNSDAGVVRAINRAGPYVNGPAEKFIVTGPGYEATEHPTLEEARAAAEASLLND